MVRLQMISALIIIVLLLLIDFSSSSDHPTATIKSALEDDLQFLFKWPGDSLLLENVSKNSQINQTDISNIKYLPLF